MDKNKKNRDKLQLSPTTTNKRFKPQLNDVIPPEYDVTLPENNDTDLTALFTFDEHSFSDLWKLLEDENNDNTIISTSPENVFISPENVPENVAGKLVSSENVAGVYIPVHNNISYVTINSNEESCGPSFSGEDSSVMASLDYGGISAFYSGGISAFYGGISAFYGGEISGFDFEEYDKMLARFLGEDGYEQN